ncbi:MAG: hypothetical protein NVSMB62_10840 [Acidobacteriaceae bacterium]
MRAHYPILVIAFVLASVPAHSRAQDAAATAPADTAPAAASQPQPKRVGGPVSAPTLVRAVRMPGLSRMESELVLNLWVDAEGVPSHIRILQGGDLAQNEKIIAAVRQYRFKPATENGKPVLVEMNLEVSVD